MPKFIAGETASRHRRVLLPALVITACLLVAVGGVLVVRYGIFSGREHIATTRLVLGAGTSREQAFHLETLTDTSAQAKGLGGRASLAANEGVLLSYRTVDKRCIWMKDMKFPIDIIWFDTTDRVTSSLPNLKPSTYPQTYCANARYIVELPAGTIAKHRLRPGQIIKF